MATTTYTPSMLRGAGTRGIPEIPAGSSFSNTYSLAFDGVDDYVDCGTSLNLGINSTVSFWIKRNNVGVAEVFLGENSYTFDYLLYIETTNKLYVRIAGVYKEFGSASVVSIMNDTTNWINIVIVRSGDSIELFLNGSSMGTNIGFGVVTDTRFDTIGAKFNGTFGFDGNIDEVAGWNTSLTALQVTAIYNSGTPTDLTSLNPISWWQFNEGSGTTAIDSAGSNNGTISGATYSTDVPT